jgi:hypothetical protein
MDREDDRDVDEQPDGERDEKEPGERDKQSAAAETGEPKGPEQDDTDSTSWDTDQHSDAPGPFGTG